MCVGCVRRKQAGRNPSPMDFDEGPPPFVPDDVANLNHHRLEDFLHDEPEEPSNLPLPDVRSRSVSPRHLTEFPADENDKGDTVETSVSKHDWSEFQNGGSENNEQEKNEEEEEEEDEWGDFAAPVKKAAPEKMEDDDDEWGAFDQARPSVDRPESEDPDSARQLAHQQSIEEWGAFENSTSTAVNVEDDDDEWAAEFTSAPAPAPPAPVTLESLKMLEEMLDDGEFWDDGFAEEQEQTADEISVVDIPTLFDLESLAEEAQSFESEKQRYARLWLSLRVIEEAISLKFDWKDSEVRKAHFNAIRITVNDIKKEIRSAATMFDTASLLLPTPLQPSSSSTSSEDHHNQKTSSSPSVESPSIPAADFDWDVSGLTNPMNRANQSSAIIDVDFLSTNGKATSYTNPLQKELEEFGLTLANGAGSGAMAHKGPNILETLMSRAESSSSSATGRAFRSPEVLSLDARKLLESLPDLQYLQSEVLMFPVGTNLPH